MAGDVDRDGGGLVGPRHEVGGGDPVPVEGAVQGPVRLVPDDEEGELAPVGADVGGPGGRDLAVRLDDDGVGLRLPSHAGCHLAPIPEGRVRRTVRQETGDRQTRFVPVCATTNDDSAVGLECGRKRERHRPSDPGDPALAEGRVDRSVGEVADGHRVAVGLAETDRDEPPVGLEEQRPGHVVARPQVGGGDAVAVEGQVEPAVGQVAGEGEPRVPPQPRRRVAGDHDPAVGLDHKRMENGRAA